jgi:hypothetical protein
MTPLLFCSAALAQPVLLQVEVPRELLLQAVTARVQRHGELTEVPLADDGKLPGDVPGDGVWVGWSNGDYARILPIELSLTPEGGQPTVYYAGTETLDADELVQLAWRVRVRQPSLLVDVGRVAAALPGGTPGPTRVDPLLISLGWGAVVVAIVGVAAVGRVRP